MMKTCFTISFVFWLGMLFSQNSNITATVSSDSVLIGNTIIFKVSLENVDGEIQTPVFDGFEIVSGPNVSQSVSIINGDQTSSKSYSWYLRPIGEGQYFIDPVFVEGDEISLETEPIEINVYPNPEGIIEQPRMSDENTFFQFDLPPLFDRIDPNNDPEPQKKSKRKLKKL